ncbi:High mobility group 20A [Nesidiocoris tenuis]|uniref:High mobility group 20A n=1 Tax=Nesidiocoris tenuis TaxID=355587 RepID=A0ABN7AP00_9HEMI|nr:High mobility group 20A [Nesidiocoris tenuis]
MVISIEEFLATRKCAQCGESSADVFCHKNCDHVICDRCRSAKSHEKCPTCGVLTGNLVIDRVFQQIYSCFQSDESSTPVKTPVVKRKLKRTPKALMRDERIPSTPKSPNLPTSLMKRNAKGETPLHEYCCRGFNRNPNFKLDVLRDMLGAGANPNTRDAAGITPMHEAVEACNVEILRILLDNGGLVNCYSEDSSCNTPLHVAAERFGHLEPEEKSPAWEIMTTLLNAGADMSAKDCRGRTPLSLISNSRMRAALIAYRPIVSVRKELIAPTPPIVLRPLPVNSVEHDLLAGIWNRFNVGHHLRSMEVTHILLGSDEDYMNPGFTLRLGILLGLFIVKKQWLKDSLDADSLLPADLYEIARPILVNSRLEYVSRRARINHETLKPKLFTGGQFHILTTPQQKITSDEKEKLAKLIQAGGGTLLAREPKTTRIDQDGATLFHAPEGSMFEKCSVFILFKKSPPEPMYSLPHMKHVSVQWKMSSSEPFQIQPANKAQPSAEVPISTAPLSAVAAQPGPESESQSSSLVDKSGNGTPKKVVSKNKKKRKAIKDVTAPRQPLTGYVRFLNDRRDHIRAENPNMPFSEITKVLAAEWSNLAQDQKQAYLTAAEQDRERYAQELAAYKQSDAYRIFSEQQQVVKKVKEENEENSFQEPENNEMNGYDIPIFTEDFLDHNKSREIELRQLRKSNTDYEQQNATIQTYIAGLHSSIEKLTVETQQQRSNNNALTQHLANLRSTFANVLTPINVPNLDKPTVDTIDAYMTKLLAYVKENPQSTITANVRKAIADLELQA